MRPVVASVLTTILLLMAATSAHADRIDRLIQILRTDPSYKVRLQVAITLGKLKDKRSVPALLRTLRDENETVQGVAAAALGQIGDSRAVPGLKALLGRTSNSFVKGQAVRALGRLGGGGGSGSPPANARFYVTVGKMKDKTGKGGKKLSQAFARALLKEFSKVRSVATSWAGGGKPSASALSKRRMKGYVLDGAITQLSHRQNGSNIEVSCSIRVSLATYPDNSMKAFYSGGASMAVPSRGFDPSNAYGLYKDLVEGAATGAQQHIVQSYLSHQ